MREYISFAVAFLESLSDRDLRRFIRKSLRRHGHLCCDVPGDPEELSLMVEGHVESIRRDAKSWVAVNGGSG